MRYVDFDDFIPRKGVYRARWKQTLRIRGAGQDLEQDWDTIGDGSSFHSHLVRGTGLRRRVERFAVYLEHVRATADLQSQVNVGFPRFRDSRLSYSPIRKHD